MGWIMREAECERGDEVRTFYSVEPDWGPEHEPHPHCWCEPELDPDYHGLVIHREVH